jgi:hypothetical protein
MSKVESVNSNEVRLVVKHCETKEFVCLVLGDSFDAAMDLVPSGPYYVKHQNDPDWKIV